jgi:hypothetical protein
VRRKIIAAILHDSSEKREVVAAVSSTACRREKKWIGGE